MTEILLIAIIIILGFGTGILIGMLGIGGGLIFVPVLYFILPLFDIPPSQLVFVTVGTSLFAGAIASTSSGLLHYFKKNVILREAKILAAGSVLSAFILPFFITKVNSTLLEIIVGSFLLLLASKMFLEKNNEHAKKRSGTVDDKILIVIGLCAGALSAFTGFGGGILYVPVLFYIFSEDIKKAVGTSAVVTALTMISSSASFLLQTNKIVSTHLQFGYVLLPVGLALGAGAVIGTFPGVRLVLLSPQRNIKKIFSVMLLIAAVRIIFNLW